MKWKIMNRKLHYWASLFIALQVLIIVCTGSLLLLKKQLNWVEPKTIHGVAHSPQITYPQILAQLKTITQTHITGWVDVDRIDTRPNQGVVKVRTKDRWEIQLDAKTGAILHVAKRNASLIASIHTGTWFHPLARYLIFLPTAIILFLMVITGTIMALTRLKSSLRISSDRNGNRVVRPS